jgi:hypothetical protein
MEPEVASLSPRKDKPKTIETNKARTTAFRMVMPVTDESSGREMRTQNVSAARTSATACDILVKVMIVSRVMAGEAQCLPDQITD